MKSKMSAPSENHLTNRTSLFELKVDPDEIESIPLKFRPLPVFDHIDFDSQSDFPYTFFKYLWELFPIGDGLVTILFATKIANWNILLEVTVKCRINSTTFKRLSRLYFCHA